MRLNLHKAIFLAIFLAFTCLPLSGQSFGAETEKFALVIGVKGYPNFPVGERLKYTDTDARKFRDFIVSAAGGLFPESNVRLLLNENATRESIYREIEWIGQRAGANATVYVFFAGHGIADLSGRVYLMPYEGNKTAPTSTGGIRADDFLRDIKQGISAKNIIFFLDACHAGAAINEGGAARGNRDIVPEIIKQWNYNFTSRDAIRMGLLSASSNQLSYEDDEFKQGLFTYYLLKGLKGEADKNQDGSVTAAEIRRYVLDNVEARSENKFSSQTPVSLPAFDPDFVLAIIPHIESLNPKANYVKFFEKGFGAPVQQAQRQYATSFAKSATRSLAWEVGFGITAPGTQVSFPVKAVWYNPDGSVFTKEPPVQAMITEDGTDYYINDEGWGWKDAGNWTPGTYKVDFFFGDQKVASGTFEIYDTYVIDPQNLVADNLKFFEWVGPRPTFEQRQYNIYFFRSSTRAIYWQLQFKHPTAAARVDFKINAVWYYPDGSVFARETLPTWIEQGWRDSYATSEGWGWSDSGHWTTGQYRVDLFIGNRKIASGTFFIW